MITYSNEQLEENYNKFINALGKVFTGDRLEGLLHMYSMEELGPNLILSPASGTEHFHNAYDGGYIDHIMNVVTNSLRTLKLYEEAGGIVDFTKEELLFSAFHHDLGKLGEKDKMAFLHNPSDWHVKNQGKLYVRNPELPWLNHTDKTFVLLSQYGIKLNENEYWGIKLTDGLYDEDNKKYLMVYDKTKQVPSHIHWVLHMADSLSATIECQQFNNAPF